MRPFNVVFIYELLRDISLLKSFSIKVHIKLPVVASLTQGDLNEYLGTGSLCSAVF